jgi:hypothetical protein
MTLAGSSQPSAFSEGIPPPSTPSTKRHKKSGVAAADDGANGRGSSRPYPGRAGLSGPRCETRTICAALEAPLFDGDPHVVALQDGRRNEVPAICDRTRASGTNRCLGLPASDPTSAREGPCLGHPANPVRDQPSLRSFHHCRSGKSFRAAG